MRARRNYFIFLIYATFFTACRPKTTTTHSFYLWRSNTSLSSKEILTLHNLHITKLYLHFFDVVRDKETGYIIPTAAVKVDSKSLSNFELIPVVYFDNSALNNMKSSDAEVLSKRIVTYTNNLCGKDSIVYNEFQLDCDWNESTKATYFQIIQNTKALMPGKIISSTIRLHQVKYRNITGIPPADRGTLMFYNMGDFNPGNDDNSILNLEESEKYITTLDDYPLPLDVALPVYEWSVIFRYNKPVSIIHRTGTEELKNLPGIRQLHENSFIADTSTWFHSEYIKQNDIIKTETVTFDQLKKAASLLRRHLKNENRTVILFDLEEKNINRIKQDEILSVFNTFD